MVGANVAIGVTVLVDVGVIVCVDAGVWVGVIVRVGVGVTVPVGSGAPKPSSNAPRSHCPLPSLLPSCGRDLPLWSIGGQSKEGPVSRARLPGRSAIV